MCKIKEGKQKKLFLGNLNAKRDWGHAKDYCLAMWKILQQKEPDDYVIATGKQYSIKQFINLTAKKLKMKIIWKGKGVKEKGFDENGKSIIECDKNYFRPLDVNTLLGDARKARKKLKWKPKEDINSLIDEMIQSEYQSLDF
jgi:GDPmannose 4,6-dehydratase